MHLGGRKWEIVYSAYMGSPSHRTRLTLNIANQDWQQLAAVNLQDADAAWIPWQIASEPEGTSSSHVVSSYLAVFRRLTEHATQSIQQHQFNLVLWNRERKADRKRLILTLYRALKKQETESRIENQDGHAAPTNLPYY